MRGEQACLDSPTSWIADDIEVLGKHDLSANGYWRPLPKGFLLNLLHIIPTALMSLCLSEYFYVKLGFVEEPGRRIGIPWLFSMGLLTTAKGRLILQFNTNLLIHLQHKLDIHNFLAIPYFDKLNTLTFARASRHQRIPVTVYGQHWEWNQQTCAK